MHAVLAIQSAAELAIPLAGQVSPARPAGQSRSPWRALLCLTRPRSLATGLLASAVLLLAACGGSTDTAAPPDDSPVAAAAAPGKLELTGGALVEVLPDAKQPGAATADAPEGRPAEGAVSLEKSPPAYVAETITHKMLPVLSLESGELPALDEPVLEGEDPKRPRRFDHLESVADPERFHLQQIVIKFQEGTGVRLRDGAFTTLAALGEPVDEPVIAEIEPKQVEFELQALNEWLAKTALAQPRRAFDDATEAQLAALRSRGRLVSARITHDLDLFYFLYVQSKDPADAEATLKFVRGLPAVETAYFQPRPVASFDLPPQTTIDLTGSQGYFGAAPMGVNVNYARRFGGGRGQGVRIVDIENGWYDDHEDLPGSSRLLLRAGLNIRDHDHGTAVIGTLWAEDNGFGVTGMTPLAGMGWSSSTFVSPVFPFIGYGVGVALLQAGTVLRPGDIALIEQQYWSLAGLACPVANPCGCDQFGMVPVEAYPLDFAAIGALVAAGVTVVEAAGNGQQTVSRASGDSGAIMVGAGAPNSLAPMCFSNTGTRLDLQGWGSGVATLGYGDAAMVNGPDPLQWYTSTFSGTSSASPIVAGAAALVQSTRAAEGLPPLGPLALRSLLQATGTPQGAGALIGPRPDLRRAIATFVPDRAAIVSQSAPPVAVVAGSTFSISVTLRNTGSATWTGQHRLRTMPQPSGAQWTNTAYLLGFAGAMMMGDSFTHTVQLTAPTVPGTYPLAFGVFSNGTAAASQLAVGPTQYVVVSNPATPSTYDASQLVIVSAPGSLPRGGSGTVTVQATNTGTTTWSTFYGLNLWRTGRLALPVNRVPLTAPVPPGGSVTLSFTVMCLSNTSGLGGFSAQINAFGQQVGRNVVCQ